MMATKSFFKKPSAEERQKILRENMMFENTLS